MILLHLCYDHSFFFFPHSVNVTNDKDWVLNGKPLAFLG